MKFQCGNCQAKYQIADEKVSGRTLKMKCRKCGSDILIRGKSLSKVPPAATSPSKVGDVRASTVDMLRGSSLPQQPTIEDQWHVAINDVPVGPISQEEIQIRAQAGAITGDSLCWREGFEDWKPVQEVPELAGLVPEAAVPSEPPPSQSAAGAFEPGMEPIGSPSTGTGSVATGGVPTGDITHTASASMAGSSAAVPSLAEPSSAGSVEAEQSAPGRGLSSLPILGSESISPGQSAVPGHSAAPEGSLRVTDHPFFQSENPGVVQIPQAPAAPHMVQSAMQPAAVQPQLAPVRGVGAERASLPVSSLPPRKQSMPVGAWIAIVGAAAFGITLGVMVGLKWIWGSDGSGSRIANQEGGGRARPEFDTELADPMEAYGAAGSQTEQEGEKEPSHERRHVRSHAQGAAAKTETQAASSSEKQPAAPNDGMTAEQRAMFDRMGGGFGSHGNLRFNNGMGGRQTPTGEGLNAQQLSQVVNRNKPGLQRCYETSIRGMGAPPSVRLDIDITVGMSGIVTQVNARGNDVAGLKTCIQRSVKRWRFPSSGNLTQTSFPIVFQGA